MCATVFGLSYKKLMKGHNTIHDSSKLLWIEDGCGQIHIKIRHEVEECAIFFSDLLFYFLAFSLFSFKMFHFTLSYYENDFM